MRTGRRIYIALALLFPLVWAVEAREKDPKEGHFVRLFGTTEWGPAPTGPIEPQEAPGMLIWEVTRHPDGGQTPEQMQAAEDLIESTYRAAEKKGWFDFRAAARDGYKLLWNDEMHYVNEEYLFDDVILDPERPEYLMYYTSKNSWEKNLAGYMYFVREPLERGPQVGGAATMWHYHVFASGRCFLERLHLIGHPEEDGTCRRGVLSLRSPEMLHVWLLDHPRGPFSTDMVLDRELLPDLLERRREERGF